MVHLPAPGGEEQSLIGGDRRCRRLAVPVQTYPFVVAGGSGPASRTTMTGGPHNPRWSRPRLAALENGGGFALVGGLEAE